MVDGRFYNSKGPFLLEDILKASASFLDGELVFPPEIQKKSVQDVAPLEEALEGEITFCSGKKYEELLALTKASFCFLPKELKDHIPPSVIALYTSSPLRAFSAVSHLLYPDTRRLPQDQETQQRGEVFVHPSASLGKDVILGPGAIVQSGAVVGDGVHIGAYSIIGQNVIIGEKSFIAPHVTLFFTHLGKNTIIGPGTRIGQEGFGFVMDEKGHISIPQLGRVLIDDHVEIGANCTIDRGSLKDTRIGAYSRLDNLVHIAHNVRLGKGCVIVAQVGISGSTCLGDFVAVGGQAGLTQHLQIGSRARIGAQSGVMRDIKEGETVSGSPAIAIMEWKKQHILLSRMTQKK